MDNNDAGPILNKEFSSQKYIYVIVKVLLLVYLPEALLVKMQSSAVEKHTGNYVSITAQNYKNIVTT